MRRRNISQEERSKYVANNMYLVKFLTCFAVWFFFFFTQLRLGLYLRRCRKWRVKFLKLPALISHHGCCRYSSCAPIHWNKQCDLWLLWSIVILIILLQTCVKYCSDAERDAVYEELKPHLLTLSSSTYAVHLVTKMFDNGIAFAWDKARSEEPQVSRLVLYDTFVYIRIWLLFLQPPNLSFQDWSRYSMGMLLHFWDIVLDLLVCYTECWIKMLKSSFFDT